MIKIIEDVPGEGEKKNRKLQNDHDRNVISLFTILTSPEDDCLNTITALHNVCETLHDGNHGETFFPTANFTNTRLI